MPYKDRYGRTCGFVDFETEQEQSGRFKRRYFMISPEDASFYCYMDNPNVSYDRHQGYNVATPGRPPGTDVGQKTKNKLGK